MTQSPPGRSEREGISLVGQYVNGQVSTQGIDSFWSMVKRGYIGTFHHFSPKHLDRYVQEFAGRHNARPADTADQMAGLARGGIGKRLRYRDGAAHTASQHGQRAAHTASSPTWGSRSSQRQHTGSQPAGQ